MVFAVFTKDSIDTSFNEATKHFHCIRKLADDVIGESGLVGYGVIFRIGRIPVQTSLDAQLGLDIQPQYEAPGDLQVEQVSIHSD